jgi:hypothetical protein
MDGAMELVNISDPKSKFCQNTKLFGSCHSITPWHFSSTVVTSMSVSVRNTGCPKSRFTESILV